jgi:hypothetical protein
MSKQGKQVWVRDPALADDKVFDKCKVITDDEKQVRPASQAAAAPPVTGRSHSATVTDRLLACAQVTVKYEDGTTRAWPKDVCLDVRAESGQRAAHRHHAH